MQDIFVEMVMLKSWNEKKGDFTGLALILS